MRCDSKNSFCWPEVNNSWCLRLLDVCSMVCTAAQMVKNHGRLEYEPRQDSMKILATALFYEDRTAVFFLFFFLEEEDDCMVTIRR